jgi:DNA-binding transcriptional MerR regulator
VKPQTESEPRVDKLYYSISEVSDAAEVRPHVLRYWETQFKMLRPQKNRAGNRQYRRKDLNLVLTIRDLLYHQGYTIAGARRKLLEARRSGEVEEGRLIGASELVREDIDRGVDEVGPVATSRLEGLAVLRTGSDGHEPAAASVALASAQPMGPVQAEPVETAEPTTGSEQLSLTSQNRQATYRDVHRELEAILTVLTRPRERHA